MYGAITGEFERGASLLWVLLAAKRAATHMLASVPLATLRCYHHSGTRRWAASVHAAVVSAVGFRENGARLCVRTCCGGLYRSVSAHHMCCVVTTTGRTTLPTRLGAMSPMQCQMYARALLVVCRSCVKPARSRCGGRIVSTAGVCAAAGAIVTAMRAYPEPVLRAAHTTAQACAARARSIVGRVRPGGKLVRCVAHCLWVRHGGGWACADVYGTADDHCAAAIQRVGGAASVLLDKQGVHQPVAIAV